MKKVIKKIDKKWLDLILKGKKKFEIRLADFDIKEGDVIQLQEYKYKGNERFPTGRFVEKKVKYVQKKDLKEWVNEQPEVLEKGFYIIQFD